MCTCDVCVHVVCCLWQVCFVCVWYVWYVSAHTQGGGSNPSGWFPVLHPQSEPRGCTEHTASTWPKGRKKQGDFQPRAAQLGEFFVNRGLRKQQAESVGCDGRAEKNPGLVGGSPEGCLPGRGPSPRRTTPCCPLAHLTVPLPFK